MQSTGTLKELDVAFKTVFPPSVLTSTELSLALIANLQHDTGQLGLPAEGVGTQGVDDEVVVSCSDMIAAPGMSEKSA